MGYCIPSSHGAQVGVLIKVVWAIDGDGSFQMTNQSRATCTIIIRLAAARSLTTRAGYGAPVANSAAFSASATEHHANPRRGAQIPNSACLPRHSVWLRARSAPSTR